MVIGVPGVNGLGKTKGVKKTPSVLGIKNILDLNNNDLVEQEKQIYEFAMDLEGKQVFVGGDHSISYSSVRAFFEKNEDAKLLVFDAHLDLMEPMPEPGHEEWLRAVIELFGLTGDRVMVVGVRRNSENIDSSEIEYAKEKGIKIIYSDEFSSRRKEIVEFVSSGDIYCSFDVDVFDKSIMEATGYPEAEGLGLELLELLESLREKVKWFDLVEYNSELDEGEKGLEVVKKVLGIILK